MYNLKFQNMKKYSKYKMRKSKKIRTGCHQNIKKCLMNERWKWIYMVVNMQLDSIMQYQLRLISCVPILCPGIEVVKYLKIRFITLGK